MTGIRYEGRYPDGDNSLSILQWVDQAVTDLAVTSTFVNSQIARVINTSNLKTTTYVDAQDALLAPLSAVQTADNNYLEASAKDVSVASLDSEGMLLEDQTHPDLVTERSAFVVVGSSSFSGSYTATTTTAREKLLATLTVADPGFPWVPLCFGSVSGQAGNTPPLYPWSGNTTCGQVTVMADTGDTIYALGGGTDSPIPSALSIFPYGASNNTPVNHPPINGGITLNLYGCCFQGSGYIFHSEDLSFYVVGVPSQ